MPKAANESWGSKLHEACALGNKARVVEILSNPETDINLQDDKGNTPLMLIFDLYRYHQRQMEAKHWPIAYLLFKDSRLNRSVRNYSGKTLIELLPTTRSHNYVMETLRREGKSPVLVDAYYKDDLIRVDYFLSNPKTDVNAVDIYGDTILHAFCRNGGWKMALKLMQNRNDVELDKQNCVGMTPLHLACMHVNPKMEVIGWLTEANPAKYTISDNNALHFACLFGNMMVVDRLLMLDPYYASCLTQKNIYGYTPLTIVEIRRSLTAISSEEKREFAIKELIFQMDMEPHQGKTLKKTLAYPKERILKACDYIAASITKAIQASAAYMPSGYPLSTSTEYGALYPRIE